MLVEIGDPIPFGTWNDEDLIWRVIAIEPNRILLITNNAIDCRPFNNDEAAGNDWNTSDLKRWLETDFAQTAGITCAKPFCLSVDEALAYFDSNQARICTPTPHAVKQGAWQFEGGACFWWLRSPGCDSCYAAIVNCDGAVSTGGGAVDYTHSGVRPALWLDLSDPASKAH